MFVKGRDLEDQQMINQISSPSFSVGFFISTLILSLSGKDPIL
jgi:hypothetical protein